MKISLVGAAILLFVSSAHAQDSTKVFRASDPTQTYTYLEPSAGITFWSEPNYFGPENWQFNLKGQIGIKKFAVSFLVPVTNGGSSYSLLGDIALRTKYQFYYNSDNLFHASSLEAGVIFPTSYDGDGLVIGTYDRGFFNYFLGYTAGLNLSNDLKVYPTLQVKKYQSIERGSHYFLDNDSNYIYPDITQVAFGAGLMLSYDFNSKNFIQLSGFYEGGTWKCSDGSSIFGFDDGSISQRSWRAQVRFQHSFTNRSQAFLKLTYQLREYFGEPVNSNVGPSQINLTIGYHYLIN